MRLMFSPGASAMRSGALAIGGPKTQKARRGARLRGYCLTIFAFSALTSSVVISPTVITLPSVIFQSPNGPVMSPY
jgi:hypothetical protein